MTILAVLRGKNNKAIYGVHENIDYGKEKSCVTIIAIKYSQVKLIFIHNRKKYFSNLHLILVKKGKLLSRNNATQELAMSFGRAVSSLVGNFMLFWRLLPLPE